MAIAEHYRKPVETVPRSATVEDAALRMHESGVGSLVVVDATGAPVGILTDRDLAMKVVAEGLDPLATPVSEVMSTPLVHALPDDSVDGILALMESFGIRRVPVVENERCVGILSLDDVLFEIAADLHALGAGVHREFVQSRWRAQVEGLVSQLEEHFDDAIHWLGDASTQARSSVDQVLKQIRERVRRTDSGNR